MFGLGGGGGGEGEGFSFSQCLAGSFRLWKTLQLWFGLALVPIPHMNRIRIFLFQFWF
jgi:hypothetical protein